MDYKAIKREDILMSREVEYPLGIVEASNLEVLLERINNFGFDYFSKSGKNLIVSSGYRPGRYNEECGGAACSTHLVCGAVDLKDADMKLKEFILKYPTLLEKYDIFMEDPGKTSTWVHLDIKHRSRRIFKV